MNNKIYVGQTELSIRLITGINLANAQSVAIRYKKPNDENINHWDATIEDEVNGIIYYAISSDEDLDIAGKWRFWSYVVFNSGNVGIGYSTYYDIYNEGD